MGVDHGLSVLKNPTIVTTTAGAREAAQAVAAKKTGWAFDVEATSLYFPEAQHHGVAVATDDAEWYITYKSHPAFYAEAKRLGLFTHKWVFMHNAAYDIPFVWRYIPGIQVKVFDTLLAQFTIDENQTLGLKPLAQAKLNAPKNLPDFSELQKGAARIHDIRGHTKMRVTDFVFYDLARYAMRDVRYTYQLAEVSTKELHAVGMWDVYMNTVLPFLPVILEMESAGVYINKTKLAEIDEEYHDTLQMYQDMWNEKTDNTNPRSNPQMVELLYENLGLPIIETTKSGAPSTSSKTIQRLVDREDISNPEHPLKIFVEMSKIQTLVNVIDGTKASIEPDGRVYSKFNQTGARTGRLSSSGVKDKNGDQKGLNNQNIPVHSPEAHRVRETWAASPGKVLGVWDYSQLELRIAGHYMAQYIFMLQRKGVIEYMQKRQRYNKKIVVPTVPRLYQAFLDGEDPHQITADAIGIERKNAKTVNFGTFYGMGPTKYIVTIELATGNRLSMKQARKELDGFAIAYPEYPIWQDAVLEYLHRLGYVQTIAGRRRRLPDVTSRDWGLVSRAERQGVNAIIQGSAADIMNKASVDILHYINETPFLMGGTNVVANKDRMRIIGQVHDEIAVEGTLEQVEFAQERIKQLMVDAGTFYGLMTPLQVDGGIGSNWTEAK